MAARLRGVSTDLARRRHLAQDCCKAFPLDFVHVRAIAASADRARLREGLQSEYCEEVV